MKLHGQVRHHEQTAARPAYECIDTTLDPGRISNRDWHWVHRKRRGRGLDRAQEERSATRSRLRIEQECHPLHPRADLLEQFDPLGPHGGLVHRRPGHVAAGSGHAGDETGLNGISHLDEHDRDGVRLLLQRANPGGALDDDRVRRQLHEVLRKSPKISRTGSGAMVNPNIAPVHPSQLPERVLECLNARHCHRVALGKPGQKADPPDAFRLLRARRERPRRRAAVQRDELAPSHSITSSARASTVAGKSRPSAFAVLRLITSSYLVAACTGKSAGFSPLSMRSTYAAANRYCSTLLEP